MAGFPVLAAGLVPEACVSRPTRQCILDAVVGPASNVAEEAARLDVLGATGRLESPADLAKALEFTKANPTNDNWLPSRLQHGVVNSLTRAGKYQQAVDALGPVKAGDSGQAQQIAVIWATAGDRIKALNALNGLGMGGAMQAMPIIGITFANQGKFAEAEEFAKQNLAMHPSAHFSMALGNAYRKAGQPDKARAAYQDALKAVDLELLGDRTVVTDFNLRDKAVLHVKLGQMDAARETLAKAVQAIETPSQGTTTEFGRALAYGFLSQFLAASGDSGIVLAKSLVTNKTPQGTKDAIVAGIAKALAVDGKTSDAGMLIQSVGPGAARDEAATVLALHYAKNGKLEKALTIANEIVGERQRRITCVSIAYVNP